MTLTHDLTLTMNLQLNPQSTYQDAPGFTNLIDADTGTRYLRCPQCWQVYLWRDRAFINFFDYDLIDQLNSSFNDLGIDIN